MKNFKTFLIAIIFALSSNAMMANDTIRLKVRVSERDLTVQMSFGVTLHDRYYGVSWGDGTDTTYVSAGFYPVFDPAKTYAAPGDYEITVFGKSEDAVFMSPVFNMGHSCDVLEMDLAHAPHIEYFTCTNKPNLKKLDLRPCIILKELHIGGNKNLNELYVTDLESLGLIEAEGSGLSHVDLSGLSGVLFVDFKRNKITDLTFDAQTRKAGVPSSSFAGNQISLKTMYRLLKEGISYDGFFYVVDESEVWYQTMPNRKVNINEVISLANDTLLVGATPTQITVYGEPYGADPNDYYTVSGDQITFLKDGYYEIGLQHNSLDGSFVVIPFIAGTPYSEEITFTIDENYLEFNVYTNSGMAPITVAWGDGDTNIYYGNAAVSHTYPYSGDWTIKMNVLSSEFFQFAMIDAWDNNKGLTAIDLSEAVNLEGVFIYEQPNLSSLDLTMCPLLSELELRYNGLTDLKVDGLDSLKLLVADNNLLTTIDISGLSHLDSIYMPNNKLTEIIFDETTKLSDVGYRFDLNALSLSNIYKIYPKLDPTKGSFTKQQFRRTGTANTAYSLTLDTVFLFGKPSNIVISSNINEIEEGTDYTLSGDEVTFLTNGTYEIGIQHDSIKNANVVLTYIVGSVDAEEISFTFTGYGYELTLYTSSKEDTVTITWGDGEISQLAGSTEYRYVRKPSYAYAYGTYEVNIKAASGLYITRFMANDWDMTELDVSKAPSLTYLDVPYNYLSNLDASACKKLEMLFCEGNDLTSINLTGCTALTTLGLQENLFTELSLEGLTGLQRINMANNQLTEVQLGNDLSNLYEINADKNRLTLATIHPLAQILDHYSGTQTPVGSFKQIRESSDARVEEINDLSAEYLTLGGTVPKVSVTKDSVSAVFKQDYAMSDDGNGIIFLKNGIFEVTLTHDSIRYAHGIVLPFIATGESSIYDNIENASGIAVYPNPVMDKLYIQTPNSQVPEVKVYNAVGNLVKMIKYNEIDMSNLPKGVYFVQVDGTTFKIIK